MCSFSAPPATAGRIDRVVTVAWHSSSLRLRGGAASSYSDQYGPGLARNRRACGRARFTEDSELTKPLRQERHCEIRLPDVLLAMSRRIVLQRVMTSPPP